MCVHTFVFRMHKDSYAANLNYVGNKFLLQTMLRINLPFSQFVQMKQWLKMSAQIGNQTNWVFCGRTLMSGKVLWFKKIPNYNSYHNWKSGYLVIRVNYKIKITLFVDKMLLPLLNITKIFKTYKMDYLNILFLLHPKCFQQT